MFKVTVVQTDGSDGWDTCVLLIALQGDQRVSNRIHDRHSCIAMDLPVLAARMHRVTKIAMRRCTAMMSGFVCEPVRAAGSLENLC